MFEVPIHAGTLPSVDLQVGNARLRGAFINRKNEMQLLPTTSIVHALDDTRAILASTFNDRLIVVSGFQVFFIQDTIVNFVGSITFSQAPVRMAENNQFQVTIVNGTGAWVFDQNNGTLIKLDEVSNGFDVVNPVDVTVLDTFTIIVGGTDHKWIVSDAETALSYAANDAVVIDNQMGDLTGVKDLDNNLFIFGEGGVQRWVPSIERTPNAFPFSQDPSYRDEYGCISTASLIGENNEIFYLSSDGQIRNMNENGKMTITNDGISAIIERYSDPTESFGSYFYHKGNYVYQLSFPGEENAFVYRPSSKKWSESSDMVIGFSGNPIKTDGVYEFSEDYSTEFFEVLIQTPYIIPDNKDLTKRVVMNKVLLDMTQGKGISKDEQICDLQLSKDNILYGNRVRRRFSPVGKRLFQFRWYMNFPNNGFSLRFILQTKQDITIKSSWFTLV